MKTRSRSFVAWLFLHAAGAAMCASACGGSSFTFSEHGDAGAASSTGAGGTTADGSGTASNATGSTAADDAGGTTTDTTGGGSTATGSTGATDATGSTGATAGGTGGTSCNDGSITLRLVPASGTDPTNFCKDNCNPTGWLSISGPNGPVHFVSTCGTADCSHCQLTACPAIACVAPQPMTREGVTFTWDGTDYEPSTCDGAVGLLQCARAQCAPAGHYVATMCAPIASRDGQGGGGGTTCNPTDKMACAQVEFDLPASGQAVVGTISP